MKKKAVVWQEGESNSEPVHRSQDIDAMATTTGFGPLAFVLRTLMFSS